MGGNALKSAYTRRYNVEEYSKLLFEVTKKLSSIGIKSRVPKSFCSKDSFGDLDVLILAESLNDRKMRDIIEEVFKPNEIYQNTSVYSFDYKEFQIDFILVKTKYWDTSYYYYSYNDLGNLIGRISYQLGFRYGHYGLKLVYNHKKGGRKFEKVISNRIEDILEFLGFDSKRYMRGFKELSDIFDYVVESKYFNPKYFDYKALNHQNRTRNKKRKNYAAFLEYIKKYKEEKRFLPHIDKESFLLDAEEKFNCDLISQIKEWEKEIEKDELISLKFNGNLIMKRFPNLKGKELGKSIKKFKENIKSYLALQSILKDEKNIDPNKLLKDWMYENDVEHIFSHFKTINNLN